MTTITELSRSEDHDGEARDSAPPGRSVVRRLGIDTAYVLVNLPLAILSFTLVVAGMSAGLSLVVVWVGLPLLVGTLYVARGFAEVERSRAATVFGQPRVPVLYRKAGPDAGVWRRLLTPLTDLQYWLDVIHALVRFPVSVATFSITVTWWACALGGLTYGLWDWALPHDPENYELPEVLGFADTAQNRITLYMIIGVIFTVTLPFVVRGCALVEAWLGRALLTGVADLRSQVAGLTAERATAEARTAAAVSAEAIALKRLERDIHDGPQQRLVRLAVDLGRARQQLETDPDAAKQTVDEALVHTRDALNELRTLSRGIAPPVLTDRGLAAAVAALAARCTVPVDLEVDELPRLPALTEQTAYFTVAEALTNVAKHSDASRCTVTIRQEQDRLLVTITDDGKGGAHMAKGQGLAGLADRVQVAGGELWVSSPPGGPTRIRAEIPCPTED